MALRLAWALRQVKALIDDAGVLIGRHRTARTIIALGAVTLMGVASVSPAAAAATTPTPLAARVAVSQGDLTIPTGVDLSRILFMSGDLNPIRAARWSWCTPVRWTVDTSNIDRSGVQAAREVARWKRAVDHVAEVSGYQFTYVPSAPGSGSHAPDELPQIPGIDIVITYGSETDVHGYQDSSLASERQVATTVLKWLEAGTGVKQSIAAWVTFDYSDLDGISKSRARRPSDRIALMLHELGHAMGLGHLDDPNAMMFVRWLPNMKRFSPIDVAGLVQLAQQPCLDVPVN